MAVYVRDSDGVVIGIGEHDETIEGVTSYDEEWTPKTALWIKYKYIRNGFEDYENTEIEHPIDNDGLI